MTNIIKKLTVAILSLIVVSGVFAPFTTSFAATFNTVPGDYNTLQVSNYTQNPGSNSSWAGSISASAGEIVSFVVYYYNTAADTANGTYVHVQLPSGAFTSTTITGDVQASNAPTVTGNVSVNLTSAQSLSFIPGSAKWYPNQSTASQALLNGQSGSEVITSNGLYIGDVASQGWGTVVFRAQVSNNGGTTPSPSVNGSAPLVTTNSAYSISQNSANLQSSVNPNGSGTNAWFEYGTTQSFGNSTGYQAIGSGSVTNVNGYLSNLSANTTYYYRAAAQNSYGTSYGNTMSFTTQNFSNNGSAPLVTTNSAYSISQNSANLQSSVNPNGSGTNAWFEYGTTQSFGNTSGYQSIGSGTGITNATAYLSDLSANTTYYYRAAAQNSYGTSYGNTMSFSTQSSGNGGGYSSAPSVYTGAATYSGTNSVILNGNVNPNGNYTNVWFEYGTTQSLGYTTGYQSAGSASQSSSVTANVSGLAPGATYYYRVVGQNSYGTTYGSIVSFVVNGSISNNGSAPFVTTRDASSIFRNTALLNANVNANGSITTAWFEWGTTNSLGNRTMVQPMGQDNSVSALSAVLSGLHNGTTYYYRAVAQNGYGTSYGNTLTFTTASVLVTPVVVNNTISEPRIIFQNISGTPIAGPTVLLIPSIDNKSPHAGDVIEYTIVYRNETSHAITNSTLKVTLPNEVTYDSATLQPSTSNDHDLTFDLGIINARSQGTITIKTKVDSSIDADSALVFSSTLNYTDYRHQFQATTAYLTVMVGAGVDGLASLTSVLGSLFTNWFIDLILGLLIGFGIYHFFVRQKEDEVLVK